jgi:hypothetical protein
VQRIDRHVVALNEIENVLAAPVKQRIDLDQLVFRVGCREADAGAIDRLRTTQARDPCLGAGQRALERLDLAHMTAGQPRLLRLVEPVDAVRVDQIADRIGARKDRANTAVVAPLGIFPELVGLRK